MTANVDWLRGPDFEMDHIGIAVRSIQEALPFYSAMGWHGENDSPRVEDVPTEKVRVAFIRFRNQVSIELLESTSEEGAISKFIRKRGGGIHHICFRVKNLEEILKNLKSKNVRLIDETPKPGAHNCRVAFIHPSSAAGVLIELSQPRSENVMGVR